MKSWIAKGTSQIGPFLITQIQKIRLKFKLDSLFQEEIECD
jgi:hypothetical protein